MNRYPNLEIDLKKLRHNIEKVVERCGERGITVAGVIKGFNGIAEMTKVYEGSGVSSIASSRIEHIIRAREAGIQGPFAMIRVPMLSEVDLVVEHCEFSLNSEKSVLDAINEACLKQGKRHGVLLMADLGDLREGYWDKEELIRVARYVENQLPYVDLRGVGTNLGCYGSIKATPEKLRELVELAEAIEMGIGRRLEIISGGGTTTLPIVFDGTVPERINHLRVGEGIILAYDMMVQFGVDMTFLHQDVFTLRAEIIEVKEKPSYPVGELSYDAFGHVGEYEDRGIRKRALAALGKVDFAYPDMLMCRDKNIEIMGASSDHLILDVENCSPEIRVGDVVEFDLCYATMVFATSSENIHLTFKE